MTHSVPAAEAGNMFGKNASAGVINIVTRNPTDTLTGVVQGSYFEGDEYRVAGVVSGPIANNVDGLLSAFTSGYDGITTRYEVDLCGWRQDIADDGQQLVALIKVRTFEEESAGRLAVFVAVRGCIGRFRRIFRILGLCERKVG